MSNLQTPQLISPMIVGGSIFKVWGQLIPLKNEFILISYQFLKKLPLSGGTFVNKICYSSQFYKLYIIFYYGIAPMNQVYRSYSAHD